MWLPSHSTSQLQGRSWASLSASVLITSTKANFSFKVGGGGDGRASGSMNRAILIPNALGSAHTQGLTTQVNGSFYGIKWGPARNAKAPRLQIVRSSMLSPRPHLNDRLDPMINSVSNTDVLKISLFCNSWCRHLNKLINYRDRFIRAHAPRLAIRSITNTLKRPMKAMALNRPKAVCIWLVIEAAK
jgi:hypothetical protein